MGWKSRQAMLEYNRSYYASNKAVILEKQKAYRIAHAKEIASKSRQKYLSTRETALAQRKARYARKHEIERSQQAAYRLESLDAIRLEQRVYREINRDELNSRVRARRAANPETFREKERAWGATPERRAAAVAKAKSWVAQNRHRHNEWRRNRRKERLATDPAYKARIAIRRRFYMALRNEVYDGWAIKSGEAVRLLGCTMAEFVSYVESLWGNGMSWANWTRDGWHIDHIAPLSAFDLTDAEQLKAACRYRNLRPLWATDNLRKGARVDASLAGKDSR